MQGVKAAYLEQVEGRGVAEPARNEGHDPAEFMHPRNLCEREFFIDILLVLIHPIIQMILVDRP